LFAARLNRRNAVLLLPLALVVLVGIGLFYRSRRPPASIVTSTAPLRVNEMSVRIYRRGDEDNFDMGAIGVEAFAAQVGDRARAVVEFSEPAYAYLLALNPDGMTQLVLPESDEEVPRRASRIEMYHKEEEYFSVNDGFGTQVFLAVASRSPLPAYQEWARANRVPWDRSAGMIDAVLRYDGERFVPLLRPVPRLGEKQPERGLKISVLPPIVASACEAARSGAGVEAAAALVFPVKVWADRSDGRPVWQ
jgi:hypothetical protein